MASNSASGSKLAELEEELKDLKAQKSAELKREEGARDLILRELNNDLDRVQAAITALSSGASLATSGLEKKLDDLCNAMKGPPAPPPSYDKVMTAILHELKFLHMQSASQGMFTRYTIRKIPSTAKKAN